MWKWTVLWLTSLVVVSIVASGWTARAQVTPPNFSSRQPQPPRTPTNPYFTPLPTPRVMSGADVGFRIEGTNGSGTPVGTWVIRVNGEWLETAVVPVARRATN